MNSVEIREIINAGETQAIEDTSVSDVDLPLFRAFYQKRYST